MKKSLFVLSVFAVLFFYSSNTFSQSVRIGPRLTGNFNIYNAKGLTGTWNGLGIGIGAKLDIMFSQHIGLLVHLTAFDMKNFSNSMTQGNATQETSLSLSYLTIDPMFKAEFSGFYMMSGPSLGIKLNSSGERSQVVTGQAPQIQALNLETKSIRFDIAVGTGYNFKLSSTMSLGTDFMAYIPITDTYNFPGQSNSIFTLKLGASLGFSL